jgi:hypothetical protein
VCWEQTLSLSQNDPAKKSDRSIRFIMPGLDIELKENALLHCMSISFFIALSFSVTTQT